MNTELMFSRKSNEWSTPQQFFDELNKEFNFNLDPCSDGKNNKCKRFFTKEQDWLQQSWEGARVFCNPPYGPQIKKWVEKAYREGTKDNTLVVLLIPARTDTKYFHDFILNRSEIRFVKGRLKFGEGKHSAPFPSMVVIFRGPKVYWKGRINKNKQMMTDNELLLFDRIEVIKKTIEKYGEENFYISFSGGKDSTVLHHLIDEAIPDNKIPRVFMNTGIEYNDIRRFVEELTENDFRFVIVNSKVNIPQMLKEKGYPFKSKEHSCKLSMFQKKGTETKSVSKYINEKSFGCPDVLKYQFTDDFNLKVSDRCCYELKKHPIQRYEKESGRSVAILGLRMGEGGQRANHEGCVVFDNNHELKKFKPLNPCPNEFIEWYIESRNIELCRLYYHPFNFKRTGCKGCPYAIDLQDQLEIMEKYFPDERRQCELIWKPVYEEYRRIGYRLKRIEEKRLF